MPKRLNIEQYKKLVKHRHIIVVGGYSSRGYKYPDAVRQEVRRLLDSLVSEHGSNLLVVSGATAVGIGLVYEVAKDLDISTLGVVSELATSDELSGFCDNVLFIKDPEGSWEVKSDAGDSYLVEAAREGQMVYFGGGEVAAMEIAEAKEKGIAVSVFQHAPAS